MKRSIILLLFAFLLCTACGGRRDSRGLMGPWDELASVIAEEGWTRYRAGEYAHALDKFDVALELNPDYADAYNGQGWSYARLDSLGEAIACFDRAVDKGLTAPPDPFVGKAAISLRMADFEAAIACVNLALAVDPQYIFQHDPNIHWRTLHLILAQAYYGLGEYARAQGEVAILEPTCALDADDPITWEVEGTPYGSYEEALVMTIERLWE